MPGAGSSSATTRADRSIATIRAGRRGLARAGHAHALRRAAGQAQPFLASLAGARVHGLVDSYRSASRYNRGLARRLGLQGDLLLTPMPLHANGQTALGFGASWHF